VHDEVVLTRTTIRQAIDGAAVSLASFPSPRLEARLLLAKVLGLTKEALIARDDEPLSAGSLLELDALVERRCAGEPVAYIRGVKEFWSLEIEVDPRVLIPRPDTEILVEACLDELDARPGAAWAVDVGTGSGAVALALASSVPALRVLATDASLDALRVAALNVGKHGLGDRIIVAAGDLLAPVAPARAVLVAANLPYVPTAGIPTLDPGIRDHEPHLALDGGPDGLALVRRLVAQAPAVLAPGGTLALEVADGQAGEVVTILGDSGFRDVAIRPDLGRLKRVVAGRRA
jgi:release factor glutamine methyltransferase